MRQAPQVIGLGLLTEAIGWHGGEASASRARFEALSKDDRDALLTFLESL
ncbi:di-heme oxidoredictase family protein [Stigmatella aurantiaca]|nr:di-heme oxidoredictase family protein [Stigmatella aurantiaca]